MIDLQLNGYKGVDFNGDGVSTDAIRRACLAYRADGGHRLLATVITDELSTMAARIGRLAAAHREDPTVRDVMAGIHVEGPFISPEPGYVGAHPARHVRPATVAAAETLVAAGEGLVRSRTLAPGPGARVAGELQVNEGRCSRATTTARPPRGRGGAGSRRVAG
ncbi:MAG: hypothetical protein ACKOWG_02575, partial [Planctomycetia bacterium]